jgi:hypothetical protein
MSQRDGGDADARDDAGAAGLCETCSHVRRIKSGKGSVFILCRRSESDRRYPRYPALPVLRCPGYEVALP